MNHQRIEKINRLVCSTVNELFLTKSNDPRLAGVTITKAITSGDLRTVRIFFSLFGDEKRQAAASKALEKANGFVRSHLARVLDQKYTPKIIFQRDLNLEHAQNIDQILNELAQKNISAHVDDHDHGHQHDHDHTGCDIPSQGENQNSLVNNPDSSLVS
ncbi:MAG: 30S ribosome-binding factor RbfA [Deltaproteobacteria bacterium]|jgi:ribosome-binding factor A|nr:30S ribosome-binding factor RbfA [Deltaproteobacteria bacterium]